MNTKRKAIVLDMDETLEHGVDHFEYDHYDYGLTMVLRPHLDKLIKRLKDAKSQGTDIFLFTWGNDAWVRCLLKLKPELKELFSDIFSRNNINKWPQYSPELVKYKYGRDQYFVSLNDLLHTIPDWGDNYMLPSKPITELDYDSILFIDDNKDEEKRLRRLYEKEGDKLKKDVTYFSGFGFNGGDINFMRNLMMYSSYPEISKLVEQYIKLEGKDPGCSMMCDAIEKFLKKEYLPGLTSVDSEYSKQYSEYAKEKDEFQRKYYILAHEIFGKAEGEGNHVKRNSLININSTIRKYLSTDRKYPFEGMEYNKLVNEPYENTSNLEQSGEEIEL